MVGALTTLMLVLWIVLDLLIYFANVFEGETFALEPIYAVCVLAWKRRADIGAYLRQLPSSMWNGIVFIVTGHKNPWRTMREPSLDFFAVQNPFLESKHGKFVSADSFALSDTRNSPMRTPVVTPYHSYSPNQAPSEARHARHHSYNATESQSLLGGASSSPDSTAQMPRPYRPLPLLGKLPKRDTRDIATAAISPPLTLTLRLIIQATCSHQYPTDHYSPTIVRRLRLPRLMTLPGIDTYLLSCILLIGSLSSMYLDSTFDQSQHHFDTYTYQHRASRDDVNFGQKSAPQWIFKLQLSFNLSSTQELSTSRDILPE
ncbi:hypothetical protein EV421DRAFT_2023680 [Armillaria borealis]|uniref:Uncharacterized protein n=1 Tax=Armillaria borealis TaxID=47425 RepID=A0AA39MGY8_9AGAR|nr:hypothetical protein EV421DRAFT_2023680 [Armillaria borealis]